MSQSLTKKDIEESIDSFGLKLFKYLDKRFEGTDSKIEAVKADVDLLGNSVDAYAKQTETYMQEMLALAHKVDRMEKWILQVAQATGVKLEY